MFVGCIVADFLLIELVFLSIYFQDFFSVSVPRIIIFSLFYFYLYYLFYSKLISNLSLNWVNESMFNSIFESIRSFEIRFNWMDQNANRYINRIYILSLLCVLYNSRDKTIANFETVKLQILNSGLQIGYLQIVSKWLCDMESLISHTC